MTVAQHPLGIELFETERHRDERRLEKPARRIGEIYGGELVIVQFQQSSGVAVFDPSTDEVIPLNRDSQATADYLRAFDAYFAEGSAAQPVPHKKRVKVLVRELKRIDRSGVAKGAWWEVIIEEVSEQLL